MDTGAIQRGTKALKAKGPVRRALRVLATNLRGLYGDKTPEIVLYGSQARGDAHPESDVDVLLLFAHPVHPSTEIRRVSPLLADINLEYGVLVSVLPVEAEVFERTETAFWSNVRREGVRLGAV